MPLSRSKYEPNKYDITVILEITPRYINAGIAGDASPIFHSKTNNTKWNKLQDSLPSRVSSSQTFIDHTIEIPLKPTHQAILQYKQLDSSTNQWLYNSDILLNDNTNISTILFSALHEIFYSVLHIPLEKCQIVLLNPISDYPAPINKLIRSLISENFKPQAITHFSVPLLQLVSAGIVTALIIDFTWHGVHVVPVYDSRVLQNFVRTSNRGAKFLHYKVLEMLIDELDVLPFTNSHDLFEFIEDLIKYFYLRIDDDSEDRENFKLFDNLEIPNSKRYTVLEEFLFQNQGDIDELSIFDIIIDDLSKNIPIDCRKLIFNNTIITGDIAKLPGVKSAITKELQKNLPNYDFKIVRSLGAWSGASLINFIGQW